MIDELLENGENIYIGIVRFSGKAERICSLTKDGNLLKDTLNSLKDNNLIVWPDTETYGAFQNAYDSFVNQKKDSSNRTIIMMSDGIPTCDASLDCYVSCYDTDEEADHKVRDILKPHLEEKLKEVRDDGVKIMGLVVESDDQEEREFVDDLYTDNVDLYYKTQDGAQMVEAIRDKVKGYILENTDVKNYEETSGRIFGLEDKERRDTVDKNFDNKLFTYNATNDDEFSTSLFKQTEKGNYNKQDADKLSDLTSIYAVSGGNGGDYYTLEEPFTESYHEEGPYVKQVEIDGEMKDVNYYVVTRYHNVGYDNQDMHIAQIPAISLVTDVTATNLNVNLANGQGLFNESMPVGTNNIIMCQMDSEVVYGATSNVTYTVRVRNDSSVQCNYLELVNYYPEGYTFNEELTKQANEKFDMGCIKYKSGLDDLVKEGRVSTEDTYSKFGDKDCLVIQLDNNGQGENGFYLAPGGDLQINLVFSKVLSDLDTASPDTQNDEQDMCEVIAYKDNENRRMAYIPAEEASGSGFFRGVFPGNSDENDFSGEGTNSFEIMSPLGEGIVGNILIYGLGGLLAVSAILFITSIVLLGIKTKTRGKDK